MISSCRDMRERTEMARNANSVRKINSMILDAPGEHNVQGCQREVNRPNERLNQQLRILGTDSVSLLRRTERHRTPARPVRGERSTAVRVPPEVIEPASECRGRR